MHIEFFVSASKRFEQLLGSHFQAGLRRHGDTMGIPLGRDRPDADVVCLIGIKDANLLNHYRKKGTPVLYWDKGYHRQRGHWRVAINSNHPTEYIMDMNCRDGRRKKFGWNPLPWRAKGRHIVIAGGSGKFHSMNGMVDPTQDVAQTVALIRKFSDRPIIYRPKPSWEKAVPVEGATFSREGSIHDVLRKCHALVTRGSNASFEALMAGVPTIVTGTAVTKRIGSTALSEIEHPHCCDDEVKSRFLRNLAYHEWEPEELSNGDGWEWMKQNLTS